MGQLAEDLSLLGLPFLLSKTAEAASEYEASGCESAASAFVKAAVALKSLLNHPELAGLEEDTSDVAIGHSQQPADAPQPSSDVQTPGAASAGILQSHNKYHL